jgi:hypothetical protein
VFRISAIREAGAGDEDDIKIIESPPRSLFPPICIDISGRNSDDDEKKSVDVIDSINFKGKFRGGVGELKFL